MESFSELVFCILCVFVANFLFFFFFVQIVQVKYDIEVSKLVT